MFSVEASPSAVMSRARPMRVLYVYTHHRGGGGAENAAKATIEAAQRGGIESSLFVRSSEEIPTNLLGRLQAGASAFWPRTSVAAFSAALDHHQPDIVHISDLFPLISPFILPLCRRRGIPVVMTCMHYRLTCPVATHFREGQICTRCLGGREHNAILQNCRGNLPESVTLALYNRIDSTFSLSQRYVSHFVAPSEFTRQWFIDHTQIHPARITTISPVVQMPKTCADASKGAYIAFAGRFTQEKGIATLAEAAKLTGLPFRISRNSKSLVKIEPPSGLDLVVTDDRAGLDAFYRGARLLVFPSVWFETFGLAGAEAMSHGIPVIASRVGAGQSLVEDGRDGLLFDTGDPRDLARKILELWNDPLRCRALGEAGRKKALALWSQEHHFEAHYAIYDRLLNESLPDRQAAVAGRA